MPTIGLEPPPAVTWKVFPPATQPTYDLVDISNCAPIRCDPELLQLGKTSRRTAPALRHPGHRDRSAASMATTAEHDVQVDADQPPCLAQLSPIVPRRRGRPCRSSDPTLFQVSIVDDDLDLYPTAATIRHGVPTFAWSLLPAGRRQSQARGRDRQQRRYRFRQRITPGDIVELRVEIRIASQRRSAAPTIRRRAHDADPMCLQRQTWRVEVR